MRNLIERYLEHLVAERNVSAHTARAYRAAGPEAVAGFRRVLEQMIDDAERDAVLSLVDQAGP